MDRTRKWLGAVIALVLGVSLGVILTEPASAASSARKSNCARFAPAPYVADQICLTLYKDSHGNETVYGTFAFTPQNVAVPLQLQVDNRTVDTITIRGHGPFLGGRYGYGWWIFPHGSSIAVCGKHLFHNTSLCVRVHNW